MENAILLFVAYGILASYFEDVMHYGFLFFAVFIGLCACYASTAGAFCLMLLDDTTSTQLLLLDAERPFSTGPPNNIAHVARILARAATACSVALFLLFLTVGCEFFTEDSGPDSLPTIALKKNISESAFETQLAISTAFAVYLMLMLMLVGSNQQLNGIFLRLQYMTQSVPMAPAQAAAYATRADDLALFVRALLGLYMVICGSTGSFEPLRYKSGPGFFVSIIPEMRNGVALLFLAWCLLTDALRAFLPPALILVFILEIVDIVQVMSSVFVADLLFRDTSLTTFACAVLVMCDAACVLYNSGIRLAQKVRTMSLSGGPRRRQDTASPYVPTTTHADLDDRAMANTQELHFSEAHVNVDNIKMRVFEKKSN